ncbi:hypothetical protein AK830_g2412 [Neonectria ditissima]|uniref:Zn(2)-C6 fungal-type domain-containing protein n=1 Tax=Neonectria ditissima TaxID=78410 RepID=A0A0P7BW41_9HYPO|nr:hypothetical protein AK830_g2412 [Neonectria ditissima]
MSPPEQSRPPGFEQPRSITSRPRRRKTFTGCWTCRSRHVKCDEQRPACKRCVAGSFTCRGYDVRLTWVSSAASELPKGNRRVLSQRETESAASHSSPLDVRTTLRQLDGPCEASPMTEGPFSVFQASQPNHPAESHTTGTSPTAFSNTEPMPYEYQPSPRADGLIYALDFAPPETDGAPAPSSTPPQVLSAVDEYLGQELGQLTNNLCSDGAIIGEEFPTHPRTLDLRYNSSPSLDLSGVDQNCTARSNTEVSGIPSSYSHARTSQDNNTISSPNLALWNFQLAAGALGQPERHLDLLPAPAQQRELINHWATSLCDRLMPIKNIMNPFRIVVAPMALEGSRMANEKSSSAVAVFHAVCAASATHQSILRGGDEDDSLTLQHRNSSFMHLMRNIQSNDPSERLASLATLCIWLLSYFISGAPGAWREVIKVARDLVEQTSMETWTHSTSAALTYQCYSALVAMIQSQYLGHKEYLAPMNPSLTGSEHYKYTAIPTASLELISSFNTALLQGGSVSAEELDRLEIEFALSVPSAPDDLTLASKDLRASHHHNNLFYYTCLLYFRCNSGRSQRESEIQDLVEKCLERIEDLDAMQLKGNPLSWIYATVAFEAGTPDLRDRVRKSFACRKSLGFATWDTLLRAAEKVWSVRDGALCGQQPETWQRILAESPQFDVLLY